MKRLGILTLGLALLWGTAARAADTVYYYYTDEQGTPEVMADAQGNVIERTQYAPYGQVLNRPEHDGPGYTGHEEDAQTGLTNMQQRYADKILGRMDSVDPVDVDTTTGANFNKYAYASDNPYKFTDPDGRQAAATDCGTNGCSPNPERKKELLDASTGSHIPGSTGGENVRVIQVGSPSKSEEQKMQAQASQGSGDSAGSSGGNSSGSASQQSSGGSSQSEKVRKEWTIQDFNDLDKKATNSYAPLFLAPVALGAGSATAIVGGPPAWDAVAPVVRPLAMAACLGASFICHGASEELQELPHQFSEQKELLEKMYEGEAAEAVNWYRQVFENGQQ